MTSVTRRFVFDSAHRVMGHQGKCQHLHGHRYVAEVTCSAPSLDGLGMVVDFAVIKEKIGDWINEWWDHNTILHADDPLVYAIDPHLLNLTGKGVFRLTAPVSGVIGMNPTAENLAATLFQVAVIKLSGSGLAVENVRLWETENCYVDYTGEDYHNGEV